MRGIVQHRIDRGGGGCFIVFDLLLVLLALLLRLQLLNVAQVDEIAISLRLLV
jgi:hypothetical protein